MDKIELSAFPANRSEALTMLYLQNCDLSEKSPEEVVALYKDTYARVRTAFSGKSSPGVVTVNV